MSVAPQANQPNPAAQQQSGPFGVTPSTQASVEAEINAELEGQISPLEGEAAGYARAEERAIQDLNALFGGLLPFVAGSAQRVASAWGASNAAQTAIFNQAYSRLSALRQERAAQGQALAQQIGSPVPLSMFGDALGMEQGAAGAEFAGDLLYSQGLAQAGVQEAEAFAGRVFPLKRARMEQETRNYYRDKISDIKREIASIKAQKKGMVNERLRQRQLEDAELRLKNAELQLARTQEKNRKKEAAATLALEKKRLQEQIRANKEGERLTERGQNLTAKQKDYQNNITFANKKDGIVAITEGLLNPETSTVDVKGGRWVDSDGDGKLDKWAGSTTTVQVGGNPILNPTKLLNAVLAKAGIDKNANPRLYQFAVAQVNRSLRNRYPKMPADPAKWPEWWAKINKKPAAPPPSVKDQPQPRPGQTGRGPGDKPGDTQPPTGHDAYDKVSKAKPIGPPNTRGQYVVKVGGQYYIVSPMTETAVPVSKKRADQFAAEVRGGG